MLHIFPAFPMPSITFRSQLGLTVEWVVATSPRGLALGALAKHPQLSWFLRAPTKEEPCW